MDTPPKTLILSDGGLAALIACTLAREALTGLEPSRELLKKHRPVLMPMLGARAGGRRAIAIHRQAEILELELLPARPAEAPNESAELLNAAIAAVQAGCDRVVWPVQVGIHDLDQVARAADRALLVTRLIGLDSADHGKPGLVIDTPYADLTDQQLAELALDLDVPLHTCWWWPAADRTDEDPTLRAERERWTTVLRAAGRHISAGAR